VRVASADFAIYSSAMANRDILGEVTRENFLYLYQILSIFLSGFLHGPCRNILLRSVH